MKHITIIAGILALIVSSGRANGGEDFAFHVGEKLIYQIYWGPFVAGRATLEVNSIDQVAGHDCYHLLAKAQTTGLVDMLFHVESTSESWLDVAGLFTRRYRENRTEGKHSRRNETDFDYDDEEMITTNLVNGKLRTYPLKTPVQDIVSAIYFMRTQPLLLNVTNHMALVAGGTNYTVSIGPDQRKMIYVRPVGDISALRVEPSPTLSIVSANKGRMWLWISDDSRKIPLLLNSDMKIGTAKLVLYEIKSGNPVDDPKPRPSFTNFTSQVKLPD